MFGRTRSEKLKEKAASASALALVLAQDKRFRKRLLSAIEHGAEAGRRTRRGLGLGGAVARLAGDQELLQELRSARNDLQQAYGRLEAKRRGRKLRKLLVVAGLAAITGMPQVRERLRAAVANVSKRVPLLGLVSRPTSGRAGSATRPHRLEDLTKEELHERAQEADIRGRSDMSKEQLIEALRARS
jgi:hypothetical protein